MGKTHADLWSIEKLAFVLLKLQDHVSQGKVEK